MCGGVSHTSNIICLAFKEACHPLSTHHIISVLGDLLALRITATFGITSTCVCEFVCTPRMTSAMLTVARKSHIIIDSATLELAYATVCHGLFNHIYNPILSFCLHSPSLTPSPPSPSLLLSLRPSLTHPQGSDTYEKKYGGRALGRKTGKCFNCKQRGQHTANTCPHPTVRSL